MDDLELSAQDLAALRALMAMEPVPGSPLPAVTCSSKGRLPGAVRPPRHRLRRHDRAGDRRRSRSTRRPREATRSSSTSITARAARRARSTSATCTGGCTPRRPRVRGRARSTRGRAGDRLPQRHRPRRPVRLRAGPQALHLPGARDPRADQVPCSSGWPANARRPRLPASLTITRAAHPLRRGRGAQQLRDRRGLAASPSARCASTSRTSTASSVSPTGWPPSHGSAGATSPASTCRSASTDSPEGVYRSDPSGLYPGR